MLAFAAPIPPDPSNASLLASHTRMEIDHRKDLADPRDKTKEIDRHARSFLEACPSGS